MKTNLVNTNNQKQGQLDLPEMIFAAPQNDTLMAQYLRVFAHRSRQGTKLTQTRSDVTGTTAKVWRQKGTGRARHGSRKAPIFVGGGQAHGPKGNQRLGLGFNQRTKRQVLFSALTQKLNQSVFVTGIEKLSAKTKELDTVLRALTQDNPGSTLLVLDQPHANLIKASQNIPFVKTTQAARLNAHEVISAKHLIFAKDSIQVLTDTFSPKTPKSATTETKATSIKTTTPKTTKKENTK